MDDTYTDAAGFERHDDCEELVEHCACRCDDCGELDLECDCDF